MATQLVALRRDDEKRTRSVDVKISAPQRSLDALVRMIDGMATREDDLAIEGAIRANGVAMVTITDSAGFPLLELQLRGES